MGCGWAQLLALSVSMRGQLQHCSCCQQYPYIELRIHTVRPRSELTLVCLLLVAICRKRRTGSVWSLHSSKNTYICPCCLLGMSIMSSTVALAAAVPAAGLQRSRRGASQLIAAHNCAQNELSTDR